MQSRPQQLDVLFHLGFIYTQPRSSIVKSLEIPHFRFIQELLWILICINFQIYINIKQR